MPAFRVFEKFELLDEDFDDDDEELLECDCECDEADWSAVAYYELA
jgi:hypothetical protein